MSLQKDANGNLLRLDGGSLMRECCCENAGDPDCSNGTVQCDPGSIPTMILVDLTGLGECPECVDPPPQSQGMFQTSGQCHYETIGLNVRTAVYWGENSPGAGVGSWYLLIGCYDDMAQPVTMWFGCKSAGNSPTGAYTRLAGYGCNDSVTTREVS